MMEHLELILQKNDFKKPIEFWESATNEPDLYLKVFDPDGNLIFMKPQL